MQQPAVTTNESAERAFDAVFTAEYAGLVRLATVVCGDPAVAEEVTQDAFAAAWRRWDRLDRPGAYVQRAVVNGAVDATRRRGRAERRDRSLRVVAPTSSPPPTDPLWDLLDALPPAQRQAVVLRYHADLTVPEIAELLGRTLNTVKSDLHRAMRTLAKELAE